MEIDNNRIASLVTQISGQDTPVENRGEQRASSGENATGTASDRISLTGTARQLQELAAEIARAPVVDSQRVEAVRAAVADGSFIVDPARIAEKMISLEQALTDAR